MNCPICKSPMVRGGVSVRNSGWRLGAASFTGDQVYFQSLPSGEEKEVMRNGWVRDAFHCAQCDATLVFDGRKTGPVS
jgi:hypothetical protein